LVWVIVFEMTSRREFVKISCGLCAAISGAGILSTFLQSCTSIPVIAASPENQKISVPENSFGENILLLVRAKSLENDILLVKEKQESVFTYRALLMRCTHQEQPLTVQGSKIHCAAHGSEFDLNGNVTKEPALDPLAKFPVTLNNGIITIQIA
jgi:cytochrome b6-f complex iron-sulfur subunit